MSPFQTGTEELAALADDAMANLTEKFAKKENKVPALNLLRAPVVAGIE
ncbi:MAG: hypothetical protein ACK5NN_06870 [Sphingomonadaceae bacterium]